MFNVKRIGLKRLSEGSFVRFVVASNGDPKRLAWIDIRAKEKANEDSKIREFGISVVSAKF
jgi:arginase family enzyme